ncbi:hypothetical protein CS542_09830 [Pedobacter sp. IW39]|nr:hypothetical protein CS542_09830 [Pedobacter sp. IW39]
MADHIIPVKNIHEPVGNYNGLCCVINLTKIVDEVKVKIQELSEEVTMDTGLTEIHTELQPVAKIWSDVLKLMTSSTVTF